LRLSPKKRGKGQKNEGEKGADWKIFHDGKHGLR
jgi:hypothetical protein